jgi:hypothetical protein
MGIGAQQLCVAKSGKLKINHQITKIMRKLLTLDFWFEVSNYLPSLAGLAIAGMIFNLIFWPVYPPSTLTIIGEGILCGACLYLSYICLRVNYLCNKLSQ